MKIRGRKGITLISLVITIIILMILAGVTINLTIGNDGLFNLAKKAKNDYEQALENEEVSINELYEYLAREEELPENSKDTAAGTEVKLPEGWYEASLKYVSTEDGSVVKEAKSTSVIAVAAGNGETVPVPGGFYYVGGNFSTGVVISDNKADQNKYVGYEEDGITVKEVGVDLEGNQFVWIPCTIENYKKNNFGANYANAGWDNQTDGVEKNQIRKYGGFYIARYEAGLGDAGVSNPMQAVTAGISSTYNWWSYQSSVYTKDKVSSDVKPTSKANEIPWYHADYFTAVEMSDRMYANSNYVYSGLVTGTMWDVMVQYIASSSEYTSSGAWGNYNNSSINLDRGYYTNVTSSGTTDGFKNVTSGQKSGTRATGYSYVLLSTGASDEAKRKNVYDIAGNLCEWTTESSYVPNFSSYSNTNFDVSSYMLRGGSFYHLYSTPACFRQNNYAASTSTTFGFRVALYIR